jgi:BirA family biotin operon repressor/biotin-[acetyl-CoA-carboxylase] ligase
MNSPWSDLQRPPLSRPRIVRALAGTGWRDVRIVERTGSTNADVAEQLRAGDGDRLVLVAEEQTQGRGRLGRTWSAPPRSAVLLSVGLRPHTPAETWPVLPLLAGVSAAQALAAVGRVPAALKWPNDVLAAGRKLGGILAERVDHPGGSGVVIGIGINVSTRPAELPVPEATAVALAGGRSDREPLVVELLRTLARQIGAWTASGGDTAGIIAAYRPLCATIGQQVAVDLPSGDRRIGQAIDVDATGRLVVDDAESHRRVAYSAGDVTHLRPAGDDGKGEDDALRRLPR